MLCALSSKRERLDYQGSACRLLSDDQIASRHQVKPVRQSTPMLVILLMEQALKQAFKGYGRVIFLAPNQPL